MTHTGHTAASSDTPRRRPGREGPPEERRRRPLAPDTRRLDDRSARAWTEAMAVEPIGRGRYVVESASGAEYLVNLPAGTCTCPDHVIRDEHCKHLRRVAIEVTERRVPPPGRRRANCRGCGRESHVPESGPDLCGDCWLERGDLATDRETGDTVLVYRLTDETANEYYIDAARTSVADYPRNEGYPRDDPVVEVVYPFSGDPDDELEERPRYAFPYSRLAVRDQMVVE